MDASAQSQSGKSGAAIQQLFLDHPRSLGESYFEHLGHALRFGVEMIAAGVACVIHALVPALFSHTGSDAIKRLHLEMSRRGRFTSVHPGTAGNVSQSTVFSGH